jgi:serralysin
MVAVAVGPERVVNAIPDGDQYRPFLTALATGGYMVGWQDDSAFDSPPEDGSDDTRFAIYDAFGNREQPGTDLLANTARPSSQFEGSAATFADGSFIIAWTDYSAVADSNGDTDFNNGGVKFQMFNADGSLIGGEVHANPTTGNLDQLRQDRASIAVLADGKFVVTWVSEIVTASSTTDIIGRVFNSDGSPAGNQFTINTQMLGNQDNATVHSLSTGGFAVVWDDLESSITTGNQTKTFIRFYSAGGAAQGQPIVANTSNAGDPDEVGFAELSTGRIVITWTENQTAAPGDGSGTSIRARIYDPITQSFGNSFRVNSITSNDQFDAQVAALDNGQFVVVWSDLSSSPDDTSFGSVRMQVFDATGAKVGTEIRVNNETLFDQRNPVVTVLKDLRFVVAWEDRSGQGSYDEGFSIHTQVFDARISGIDIEGSEAEDAFDGSKFSDTIDGLAGSDTIRAGNGSDFIFGGAGIDFLFGENGNDDIEGGANHDDLSGGDGNDSLNGGTGNDKMIGGTGNDTYWVDSVLDVVIEKPNQGIDTVRTTLLSYVLPNNVERLYYDGLLKISAKGNVLDNRIVGGAGNDVFLVDAGGADEFIGGTGTDTMDFRQSVIGATVNLATGVHGGAAAGDSFTSVETFIGSSTAADSFTGGTAAVSLNGDGGGDTLNGGSKADFLNGGDGTDVLSGKAGADTLLGGRGNDQQSGGSGADIFWFTTPTASGGFGNDTISDYQDGLDKIRFALQVATGTGDFTITQNNATQVTIAMAEGNIVVQSASAFTLTASDFIFG